MREFELSNGQFFRRGFTRPVMGVLQRQYTISIDVKADRTRKPGRKCQRDGKSDIAQAQNRNALAHALHHPCFIGIGRGHANSVKRDTAGQR